MVDFLYVFVRDSAAKNQAVMRNGCWFFWDRNIQSLEWQAPQGAWRGRNEKDPNCSSDVKVRPDEHAKPKCLPRKYLSQHFGVPETCLIPKPCLHAKASQSKRFSLKDMEGIVLLCSLRQCIFHDCICKLSSNNNLVLHIYRWLMGLQPCSLSHQLDVLVSFLHYAKALFLHGKPQGSHTLQQCWRLHFAL